MALKDRYFTISEAAKEIGVTRQTISRWVRYGRISAEKIGRETLIDKDRLSRLRDEQMAEQFAEALARWLRRMVLDNLQENHYMSDDSVPLVLNQSWKHIKVRGKDDDGIVKVFDIPLNTVELIVDVDMNEGRLFRLKTMKVSVKPLNTETP